MSVQGNISLENDWQNVKILLQEYLYALSEALAGRINEFAPGGMALKGSFLPSPIHTIDNALAIDVGSPYQHASYVEFGTKPHWAPIQPLIRWVDLKQLDRIENFIQTGMTGRKRLKRRYSGSFEKSPREKQLERIAHAIQAHIAKEGTRPQKYMAQALQSLGLPFTTRFDETGATYDVDLTAYFQQKYEAALKQSGMMQ
jgi:hypothetical protein